MTNSYEYHELTSAFPLMNEQALKELAADIAANGLRDPIVLLDDKVLDGRNRIVACAMCDPPIDPDVIPFDALLHGDSPEAYIQSKNKCRRHLCAEQSRPQPNMNLKNVVNIRSQIACWSDAVLQKLNDNQVQQLMNLIESFEGNFGVLWTMVQERIISQNPYDQNSDNQETKSSNSLNKTVVDWVENNPSTETQDTEVQDDDGHAVPKMSSYVRAEKKAEKKKESKKANKTQASENPPDSPSDESSGVTGTSTLETKTAATNAPQASSETKYVSLDEFIASGEKVTKDSAVFDPETGERMHFAKLARLVMEAKGQSEDTSVQETTGDTEESQPEPVHTVVRGNTTSLPSFDRDVEVTRLILMLLNGGWLKQETGTPGTLAAEVERILAKHNVAVENAEVEALMNSHGYENHDDNVHEVSTPKPASKKAKAEPVAFDTNTLNNVDWSNPDPGMDAIVNKEVDGVPAVFLSHVKQIEEEINAESTTKAIAAVCEKIKIDGGCMYPPNAFRKCDLKKLWQGIKQEHPTVVAEWSNESITIFPSQVG